MALNDTSIHLMLDALDETAQVDFVGIHTLTDPGTGTTANAGEASGGSPAYARQGVVWGAASGKAKSNTGALTFDVGPGTYGFYTLWTAVTGNTTEYRGYLPFGGNVKGMFSVDTTLTNDQLLSVAHGLANDDRVMLFNVFSEALPTGLAEGTIYYVVNVTTNAFKVSATQGGAAVDITALGGGEGFWQKVVPEVFGAQGQIVANVGALVLDGNVL